MTIWDALTAEFDAWASQGRQAALWWRDDDAAVPSAALDQLLSLSATYEAPITLAVIPARTGEDLAQYLADKPLVHIAQHGYAHQNHALHDAKTIELGGEKPVADIIEDIKAGQVVFQQVFGCEPKMMVPPWNRIDQSVINILPDLGFAALSCFSNKPSLKDLPAGLQRLNTHGDPIDWRGTRGFAGDEVVIRPVIDALSAQREGDCVSEPTGLLTHHMDHDVAVWHFVEALLEHVADHPGACWVTAA